MGVRKSDAKSFYFRSGLMLISSQRQCHVCIYRISSSEGLPGLQVIFAEQGSIASQRRHHTYFSDPLSLPYSFPLFFLANLPLPASATFCRSVDYHPLIVKGQVVRFSLSTNSAPSLTFFYFSQLALSSYELCCLQLSLPPDIRRLHSVTVLI